MTPSRSICDNSKPWVLFALFLGSISFSPAFAENRNADLALSLRLEGRTYEHGDGVKRDPEKAIQLYCEAARLGDIEAQYNLGWMYANGRGIQRDDATAAYFFSMAAKQGDPLSLRMLRQVGDPVSKVPECLFDSDGHDIWPKRFLNTKKSWIWCLSLPRNMGSTLDWQWQLSVPNQILTRLLYHQRMHKA